MKKEKTMNVQEQVYHMIQSRLARICASEYRNALGKRKRGVPIVYSETVHDLVRLSSTVLIMSASDAEGVAAQITNGEIQERFLND